MNFSFNINQSMTPIIKIMEFRDYLLQDQEYIDAMPLPLRAFNLLITSMVKKKQNRKKYNPNKNLPIETKCLKQQIPKPHYLSNRDLHSKKVAPP
jgi:hypothetical protein